MNYKNKKKLITFSTIATSAIILSAPFFFEFKKFI